MSGLFGGASKATTHATQAMGIDFQGAQYGQVVPVLYGRNKVAGNCIWYGDFQSHAQQQKQGKGGGGGGTTNYTYSASAQMGLCEGPGIGLVTVYDGTSVVNLSSLNYAFASGAIGQAPWSHLSGSAALGYSLTAVFSFQNLDLGSQASLPNYNYELDGLKPFSASIRDANPRDILSDICSDPYHGVSFPYLSDLTQYSNYCVANSLFLSPVYDQQQSANQALSDLFKYTNTYVYYSEDQLKIVPLGDTVVTGNGVTFTPNVTPVVNLGTDDFLADGAGATITVERKAPQDNMNLVRVEFKDRANTYHDSAAVAAIDEDIITNGGRSDNSETVNGCTSATVARFIGQNLVQRAFYVRNTYQFKLSWRYCYLEPTDIVTLTDASLGLNLYPVRITEIEEDGESALTITAEEFPEGIGHSAIYNTQPNGGTNIDQNSDPGAVNPPYLFRGPGFLVGNNTPEIWCAVNGSNAMWAGCEVYLSHDGSSYTFAGTVASQARYGSLNTALPAGAADPDTTNTPTVQVYAPAQLLGGSQTDADNFVTLAMVDTEVFAYETATLTGANTYQLGYLRRGGYGSDNVAHSVGAPFVRLDDSIFRMPVDPSLIGSTVYLKFLSINAFGRAPRTLADETAYSYVVGSNVELPDVPDAPAGFAVLPVADGVQVTWSNDNPQAVGCTSIEYATASGGPWTVLAQEGPTATAYHHGFTTGSTYYYRARARGPLVQSGWSAYTSEISSTGKTVNASGMDTPTVGNPNFVVGLAGWSPDGTGWTAQSTGSPNPQITTCAEYYRNGVSGNGGLYNNTVNPCAPGDRFTATGQILANSGTGNAYIGIAWFNSSKALIVSSFGNPITGNTTGTSRVVGTAPAGAVYCEAVCAVLGYTGSGAYAFTGITLVPQPNTLAETPDGGGRYAVHAVDGNNLALVDFSQGGHVNKTQDFIADGATYARAKAAALQNGIPLQANTGRSLVVNGGFELNTSGSAMGDGWGIPGLNMARALGVAGAPSHAVLMFNLAPGSVVATGLVLSGLNSGTNFAVRVGDTVRISADFASAGNTTFPAGITAVFQVSIVFVDSSGATISSVTALANLSASGWNNQSASGVVPNGTASAYCQVLAYTNNTTGAAYTIPPGQYPFLAYVDNIAAYAVASLDTDTMDGTVYGRLANADIFQSGGVNRLGLRIPGSAHRLGDQGNAPASLTSSLGMVRSATALTAFSTGAVNVNAHTVTYGPRVVPYNAVTNAVTGLAQGSGYYIYCRDNGAGGSPTWNATTSAQVANGFDDGYNAGYVTIPTSGSSGGGGSGGPGPGGGCVCADMALWPLFMGWRRALTAGDLARRWRWWKPWLWFLRGPDGWHLVRRRPRIVQEYCVRPIIADGSHVDCSVHTPVTTRTGESILAPHLFGHGMATCSGWQRVTDVITLPDLRDVVRICVGGNSFFASADGWRFISTHNVWKN